MSIKHPPLYPWFPHTLSNYEYAPTDIVYVPYMKSSEVFDDVCPAYADMAYRTKEDASQHFWISQISDGDVVEVRMTTVRAFLADFNWDGMNAFWTIGGRDFKKAYKKIYPDWDV